LLLAAATLALLYWRAAHRLRVGPLRDALSRLTAVVLGWLGGETAVGMAMGPDWAEAAVRGTYLAIAFLPPAVYRLVRTIDDRGGRGPRLLQAALEAVAVVAGVAVVTTDLVIAGAGGTSGGYHRVSGPYFAAFTVILFTGIAATLVAGGLAARRASEPLRRLRARYFLAAVAVNATIGLVDLAILQPLGIQLHRAFTLSLGLAVSGGLVLRACVQTRLVDLSTAFRRTLVHACLVAALLLPCLGVALGSEWLFTGRIDVGPSFVTAALLCLAGFGFPRLRMTTERSLEQVVFGARADHRRLLRDASAEVTSVLELRTLARVVRSTLAGAFGESVGRLWLCREDGPTPIDDDEPVGASAAAALVWAASGRDAVVVDELDAPDTAEVVRRLRQAGIDVVVPLRVKERTVGILTLGRSGDDRVFSDDDVALVTTLANQVAIALENARLYAELRESREQVSRASRLSAVGTLAAGIAHEIRNPLVAVRTFLQLLPHRLSDAEFLRDFRQLALDEVERVSHLTTQLLTFARSHERKLGLVDLARIADAVTTLLSSEAMNHEVRLELETAGSVPPVHGDADQLRQVVLNLVLNALQASPREGRVRVRVAGARGLDGAQHVRLDVTDEGPGVPEENREAIFGPFFTTRDGATGLGLCVALQIAEEHGGTIDVATAAGVGATFLLDLPAARVDADVRRPRPEPPAPRPRWGHELDERESA
jgi:signal transduction histidine kinase